VRWFSSRRHCTTTCLSGNQTNKNGKVYDAKARESVASLCNTRWHTARGGFTLRKSVLMQEVPGVADSLNKNVQSSRNYRPKSVYSRGKGLMPTLTNPRSSFVPETAIPWQRLAADAARAAREAAVPGRGLAPELSTFVHLENFLCRPTCPLALCLTGGLAHQTHNNRMNIKLPADTAQTAILNCGLSM